MLPVASEALYNGPRLFIQPGQPFYSLGDLAKTSALYALATGILSGGIAFVASAKFSVSLIVAGVSSLVSFIALFILRSPRFSRPAYPERDLSLLNQPLNPQERPDDFRRFVHLVVEVPFFASQVYRQCSQQQNGQAIQKREVLKWARQLEALRLAKELKNPSLKQEAEAFLAERIKGDPFWFDIASCYEAHHWQQKMLENTFRQHLQHPLPMDKQFIQAHPELLTSFDDLSFSLENHHLHQIKELCPQLQTLIFKANPSLTEEGIYFLSELTHLHTLRIKESLLFTPHVLNLLLNLTDLKELEIDCAHLTPASLDVLVQFPHLRRLSLRGGAHLPPEAFDRLARLTKLEHLELVDFNIHNDSLQRLIPLNQLTSLALRRTRAHPLPYPAHYAHLDSFPKLERLVLDPDPADVQTYESMTRLPSLRSLTLRSNQTSDQALQLLSGLTQVEELILRDCHRVTAGGFYHLRGWEKLKTLDLSDMGLNMADLPLDLFSQLENLYLRDAKRFSADKINKLTSLKRVDLSKMALNDELLSKLRLNPGLEELRLDYCDSVNSNGFSHLAHMCKNLKTFYFSETRTAGNDLFERLLLLSPLKQLQTIVLSSVLPEDPAEMDLSTDQALDKQRIRRLILIKN